MRREGHPTPRWVKLFGLVIGALVHIALLLMLAGIGGPHGPARHLPRDTGGGARSPIPAQPLAAPEADPSPAESPAGARR